MTLYECLYLCLLAKLSGNGLIDFLQVFGRIGFKMNIALWVILDSLHLYLPYLALQQYTATGWCTVLHYYITSLELTLPGNAVAYLLEMLRLRTTIRLHLPYL